jgi:molybdopterin/thiamine biosynthesis adenylyltransferase
MFCFEDTRYNRQECMPEWGIHGQAMLASAKVVVIGAGGVKSTLLLDLVAAGVGTIRIIEFDRVEMSNLNRQLLYRTDDIGKQKGAAALSTLRALNPEIQIEWVAEKVEPHNALSLLQGHDIVVEGGDSPAGRNLVNETCLRGKLPFVHASAQFSYGYVFSVIPAWQTACFACFFPTDHTRATHTGPVPVNALSTSIAGTLGAAEVIKWLLGHHESIIANRRLCFSSLLLSAEFTYEDQPRRPDCPICSVTYQQSTNEGG